MNRWFLVAGIVSLATFLLHIIGGEFTVHRPALTSDISHELKAYISVLWHAVTAMIALNTIALLWVAKIVRFEASLVLLILGQNFATAAVFITYGLLRHGSLLPMPQWTFFMLITLLILIGLTKNRSAEFIGETL